MLGSAARLTNRISLRAFLPSERQATSPRLSSCFSLLLYSLPPLCPLLLLLQTALEDDFQTCVFTRFFTSKIQTSTACWTSSPYLLTPELKRSKSNQIIIFFTQIGIQSLCSNLHIVSLRTCIYHLITKDSKWGIPSLVYFKVQFHFWD